MYYVARIFKHDARAAIRKFDINNNNMFYSTSAIQKNVSRASESQQGRMQVYMQVYVSQTMETRNKIRMTIIIITILIIIIKRMILIIIIINMCSVILCS